MIEKKLEQLGLNKNEVKIYLAILPLGTAVSSTLARKTGLAKSTANYTCLQLAKKGLITKSQKKNYFVFTANNPDRIKLLLEIQKREISKKEREAESIAIELQSIFNPSTNLPKVRFFEGPEQIIEMLNEVLSFDTTLFVAAKIEKDMHPLVKTYLNGIYEENRRKKKSPTYLLYNNDQETNDYKALETRKNAYSLFVPESNFPFRATCHIYQGRVAFYSFARHDMTGVIIENENIFEMQKALFKLSWNSALKLPINQGSSFSELF